ncbi:uncharacterized protein LOC108666414 [Hyalella azteca]|uniref:Uncharacterized protein LOC108666414 n=1 Tax=Hyalella azteca TaxID=294128 RepID=A0A8B7N596_HYAAZ|nr:uncharacterized protein LOC108666414 [Hyalella azteca]
MSSSDDFSTPVKRSVKKKMKKTVWVLPGLTMLDDKEEQLQNRGSRGPPQVEPTSENRSSKAEKRRRTHQREVRKRESEQQHVGESSIASAPSSSKAEERRMRRQNKQQRKETQPQQVGESSVSSAPSSSKAEERRMRRQNKQERKETQPQQVGESSVTSAQAHGEVDGKVVTPDRVAPLELDPTDPPRAELDNDISEARDLGQEPESSLNEELRGLALQAKDNLEYSRSTDANSTGGRSRPYRAAALKPSVVLSRVDAELSTDESDGGNQAYVPQQESQDSSDGRSATDGEKAGEDAYQRKLRLRREARRAQSQREGRRFKRPSGSLKNVHLPNFDSYGRPYSQAPMALASRRRRLALSALGEPRSAPSRKRALTPSQLLDPQKLTTTRDGVNIFLNVAARSQRSGNLDVPPCHEEPILGRTSQDDLRSLLPDTSSMLYDIERYIIKVVARRTIMAAFGFDSEQKKNKKARQDKAIDDEGEASMPGGGDEHDGNSQKSGKAAGETRAAAPGHDHDETSSSTSEADDVASSSNKTAPLGAGSRNRPQTPDRLQYECLIPSCNGLTKPRHMRRHYESIHGFSEENAKLLHNCHRRLHDIDTRQTSKPRMSARELGDRENLVLALIRNLQTPLPCANEDMSVALLPLALLSILVDGRGSGHIYEAQVATLKQRIETGKTDAEVLASAAALNSEDSDMECSGMFQSGSGGAETKTVVAQSKSFPAAEDKDDERDDDPVDCQGRAFCYLGQDETPIKRWVSLCPQCFSPFAILKLRDHLKATHKKNAAAATAAFEMASLHKRLVRLSAIPLNGQPLAKYVPPTAVEELREAFGRAQGARTLLAMEPRPVQIVEVGDGLNSLKRGPGTSLVTQAFIHYKSPEFKESFPKLSRVLNDFHLSLIALEKPEKGHAAATKTFKEFLSIFLTHLFNIPAEKRTDMEIKEVLMQLNTAMTVYRQKVGGNMMPDSIKRYMCSVVRFASYVNSLNLPAKVIGNYSLSNIENLVKSQKRIISDDVETYAHFKTIGRNVRRHTPTRESFRFGSPVIAAWLEKGPRRRKQPLAPQHSEEEQTAANAHAMEDAPNENDPSLATDAHLDLEVTTQVDRDDVERYDAQKSPILPPTQTSSSTKEGKTGGQHKQKMKF